MRLKATSLYPLKFNPIYKEKIWGGQKLKTILQKDFSPLTNCGESWELSGVPGNESIVKDGDLKGRSVSDLVKEYDVDLLGKYVIETFGEEFPLLIKFLDAKEDLSIQVHPDETLAQRKHNSHGKTEMWYIMQADEGASLISGLKRKTTKEEIVDLVRENQLTKVLNREKVTSGDVFFIPSGRVHTIGAGILLAEIQQSSDLTYRIYDFDRIDKNGNKRELHLEEALDAINFEAKDSFKSTYKTIINNSTEIVDCPYFTTNKISFDDNLKRNYTDLDSFIIYMCVDGRAEIETSNFNTTIEKGEVILIPAAFTELDLIPTQSCEILEIYIKPPADGPK